MKKHDIFNGRFYDNSDYEFLSSDWNYMIDELTQLEEEEGEKTYVVLGKIGRWDGTYEGGKVISEIGKIFSLLAEDLDFTRITLESNCVKMVTVHHDGTNEFYVKELTKEGERFFENHQDELTDRELHQKLFNDSHLSRNCIVVKKYLGLSK